MKQNNYPLNTSNIIENSYYNTNKECGDDLKKSNVKAKSQEEIILNIFKNKIELSASEAWVIYNTDGITPITSIHRAITNLCGQGKLVKSNKKKDGIYGKKEYIYKISSINNAGLTNINQLTLFNV